MFIINEDKSIYITRGDVAFFSIEAKTDTGETFKFQPGDVIRFKVFERKACENVVLTKDFGIEAESDEVDIYLEEKDTKIGDVISKPVDYWYEVELNPYTDPQTIIGYDDDGAKVFKLYPEGNEAEDNEPITPEDIPVVDEELDLTSTRPVQNQAIARAILKINEDVKARIDEFQEQVYEGISDFKGHRLENVAEPEVDTDAATKKYTDESIKKYTDESKEYTDESIAEVTATIPKVKTVSFTISAEANVRQDVDVNWGTDITPICYGIQKVVGVAATEDVKFCQFISSTKVRVVSTRAQNVNVEMFCLYSSPEAHIQTEE